MDTTPTTSRRNLLTSAAAFAGIAPLALASLAAAEDATPAPAKEQLLFVQVAESGTAEPVEGEPGGYRVILVNGSGQTIYFSDRPERLAGIFATSDFLADVASAAVRPNAALVFRVGNDDAAPKVAPMELSEPDFDSATNEVSYLARIIGIDGSGTLAASDPSLAVDGLPQGFAEATLFIDSIDVDGTRYIPGQYIDFSGGVTQRIP